MKSDVHVVIIGAGIIGLSCAYWLSKFGVEDILVVDREEDVSLGSTKACSGIITENFTDPTLIKLAIESIRLYRDIPCNSNRVGQVFVYEDIEKSENARSVAEKQRDEGLSVSEIPADRLVHTIPGAFLDDINLALHYKGDAVADVGKVVEFYKSACDAREVEFMFGTTVRHISSKEGSVSEILTSRGRIKTSIVINAAGAHAGVIGHVASVDVLVLPLRIHTLKTGPLSELSSRLPVVNDTRYELVSKFLASGVTLIQKYHHEEHGFKTGVEEHFLHDMMYDAEKRFPAFSKARVVSSSSGYYAMTPDEKPIIGPTSLKGFYCACGFSGHGFTFAPVVGMVIADLIVHSESRHDITGLELKRFKKIKKD